MTAAPMLDSWERVLGAAFMAARRRGFPSEAARDVRQEVVARLLAAGQDLPVPLRLVRIMVRRLLVDELRRLTVRLRWERSLPRAEPSMPARQHDALEGREAMDRVRAAWPRLTPAQRAALTAHMAGEPAEDAAARLGTTVNAVRVAACKGRQRLARELA